MDESPININKLIAFYKNLKITPKEIRQSISHLSWDKQMQKVIQNITNTNL